MKLYKTGKVVSIGKTYVIFESNSNGFILNVNNPNDFEKDKDLKVFIYEYKTEYITTLYGFKYFKARVLFEDLISVSGIGPKTAMNVLKLGHNKLVDAIIDQDSAKISSVKSIGQTTAKQLIFELRTKYLNMRGSKEGKLPSQKISNTLKTLGFSKSQIEFAIKKVKPSKNLEDMVEKAIILISNEYQPTAR